MSKHDSLLDGLHWEIKTLKKKLEVNDTDLWVSIWKKMTETDDISIYHDYMEYMKDNFIIRKK